MVPWKRQANLLSPIGKGRETVRHQRERKERSSQHARERAQIPKKKEQDCVLPKRNRTYWLKTRKGTNFSGKKKRFFPKEKKIELLWDGGHLPVERRKRRPMRATEEKERK